MRAPDMHAERALAVVGITASPLTGAFGKSRVTAGPDTQRDSHGCLGVVQRVVGVIGQERPYQLTVDVKVEGILCPVGSVVVENIHYTVIHGVVDGVVKVLYALAEVVGLSMGMISTHELPVDLIQVVAEKHDRADDAGSSRRLHPDFHTAEEDVELGPNGWRVALLVDGESGAIGAIVRNWSYGSLPSARGCVEVEVEVHAKSRVWRTISSVEWLTVGADLGNDVVKQTCRGKQRNGRRP